MHNQTHTSLICKYLISKHFISRHFLFPNIYKTLNQTTARSKGRKICQTPAPQQIIFLMEGLGNSNFYLYILLNFKIKYTF